MKGRGGGERKRKKGEEERGREIGEDKEKSRKEPTKYRE